MSAADVFDSLIDELIDTKYLKSESIILAFRKIKRADFIPLEVKSVSAQNVALPIGFGQTISQPLTVAFMLELLAPVAGQRVLDIGSGSGWTTALLAQIVGHSGQVYAVERIMELVWRSQQNIAPYDLTNVTILHGDGTNGLPKYCPFDRILVSAAATKIPPALLEQLAPNGRLVIPLSNGDIRLIIKNERDKITSRSFSGFIFVPLIEDKK